MLPKKGLGKGLNALLNLDESVSDVLKERNVSVSDIAISDIEPNKNQPRTHFEESALQDLANSIKQLGLIQPITVRKMGAKFQIISGERRFRAAQIAGLKKLPAYIREANDQELLEMALVENIQREELDSIEIALGYQRLMEECNLDVDTISERVAKDKSTVQNYIRLLKLPAPIQHALMNKSISMGHARSLIAIDDTKEQIKLFNKVIAKSLSVRQTEEATKLLKATKKASNKPVSTNYKAIEQRLKQSTKLPVSITKSANGKGAIKFTFLTEAELTAFLNYFK